MAIFRSILIADDEASIRNVLTLVLKDRGYDVRAVSNGDTNVHCCPMEWTNTS